MNWLRVAKLTLGPALSLAMGLPPVGLLGSAIDFGGKLIEFGCHPRLFARRRALAIDPFNLFPVCQLLGNAAITFDLSRSLRHDPVEFFLDFGNRRKPFRPARNPRPRVHDSPHHVERIEAMGGSGKTYLITDYAERSDEGRAIVDPFGGGLDIYRSTVDELERVMVLVFDRIASERPRNSGAV